MATLHEVSNQYIELFALIENPESEGMAEAIKNSLDGIQVEFEEKAKSIAYIITNACSDIDSIDSEIDRLSERKKAMSKKIDSVKEYLRQNMEACEIKKISSPLHTITLATGREIVDITDENVIPDEYMSVTTKIQPDKKMILTKLKDNPDAIEGARLKRSQSSVRVK